MRELDESTHVFLIHPFFLPIASTVATQEVTTVIVTTSLGATNTITLATQTVLPTLVTTVIREPSPTNVNNGGASPKPATNVPSQGTTTTLVPTAQRTAYGANAAEV